MIVRKHGEKYDGSFLIGFMVLLTLLFVTYMFVFPFIRNSLIQLSGPSINLPGIEVNLKY